MTPLLNAWPRYLTEFLGTLFLVLIIGLSIGSGSPFQALSIGLGLAVLVYMGLNISGAHYNPAITLALAINRHISWQMGGLYLLSQLAGAAAGAGIAQLLVQDDAFSVAIVPPGSASTAEILLAEMLFSFLLVLVFCFVTVSENQRGNSHYGLSVGLTLFIALIAAGDISGGILNPAAAFGRNIISLDFVPMWYYWVGPLLGGCLGALIFRALSPNDIPAPTRKVKAIAEEIIEEMGEEEYPEEDVMGEEEMVEEQS